MENGSKSSPYLGRSGSDWGTKIVARSPSDRFWALPASFVDMLRTGSLFQLKPVERRRKEAYAPVSGEDPEGARPGIFPHYKKSAIPQTCWPVMLGDGNTLTTLAFASGKA